MSWIDKIFKQHLQERNFSQEKKDEGWSALEKNFSDQLGNITVTKTRSNFRFYLGVLVGVLLAVVPAVLWLYPTESTEPSSNPNPQQQEVTITEPKNTTNPSTAISRSNTDQVEPVKPVITTDASQPESKITSTDNIEQPSEVGSVAIDKAQQRIEATSQKEGTNPAVISANSQIAQETKIEPEAIALNNNIEAGQNPETEEEPGEIKNVDSPESAPLTPPVVTNAEIDPEMEIDSEINEPEETLAKKDEPKQQAEAAQIVSKPEESPKPESEETLPTEDNVTVNNTESDEEVEDLAPLKLSPFADEDQNLAFSINEDDNERSFFPDISLLSSKRFSISLWGGYAQVGKTLESDDGEYLALRESEKALNAIPTGFDLDYFITENWTFGTGLSWAEYGEKVEYEFSYTDYPLRWLQASFYVDGRYGDPRAYPNIISIDSTRIIDSINVGHWNYNVVAEYSVNDTVESSSSYSGINSWQYVEVPLTIGFRFGKGYIRPWLKAGLTIGLPIQVNYTYPVRNNNRFEVDEPNSQAPILYHYQFSAGIDCYISRNWSIRLDGFGSRQINNALQENGIKQRYYRLGARLGIAYNF